MNMLLWLLISIEGATMGTTYHVKYFDAKNRNFKESIDSVLVVVNRSINNYDPLSEISLFNKSETGVRYSFQNVLKTASDVYEESGGAFDPTVMPLVNAWGFGPRGKTPDTTRIDSLRKLVGFNKIHFNNDSLWKSDPRTQLDFGGIGQGYGADVVANFLRSKGVENMFVELGGEGLAIGRNLEKDKPWRIAILDPEDLDAFKAYVSLSDRAYTTSGNYYNYREVNGQRFAHTINPKAGSPAMTDILSVTVFAKDATTADAWDTALMVLGSEGAKQVLKNHRDLDAFIVYSTPHGTETFVTKGIRRHLEIVK